VYWVLKVFVASAELSGKPKAGFPAFGFFKKLQIIPQAPDRLPML
jgi:hypothetical protein